MPQKQQKTISDLFYSQYCSYMITARIKKKYTIGTGENLLTIFQCAMQDVYEKFSVQINLKKEILLDSMNNFLYTETIHQHILRK